MSFATGVKQELCREKMSADCCVRAEAYGVLLFCNTFCVDHVRVTTRCEAFARRLPRLFRRAFDLSFDEKPEGPTAGGSMSFRINDPNSMARILETYGYAPQNSVSLHLNYAILEEDCCRSSFLRGAFLAGGSITDPEKSYHLELATSHLFVHRELQNLLREMEFMPKTVNRGGRYVTYLKRSEEIADFLTTLGAPVASMDLMNAKVEKTLRNGVNRASNCDVANVDKAVDAAQSQIEAIRRLERGVGLEFLPDKLHQTALLRLENPELSLSQLAELEGVSKSCLNHRLRRLAELAEQQN